MKIKLSTLSQRIILTILFLCLIFLSIYLIIQKQIVLVCIGIILCLVSLLSIISELFFRKIILTNDRVVLCNILGKKEILYDNVLDIVVENSFFLYAKNIYIIFNLKNNKKIMVLGCSSFFGWITNKDKKNTEQIVLLIKQKIAIK